MRLGRRARTVITVFAAALACLGAAGSAGAAGWGEKVKFPGSEGISFPQIPAAELDADGGGAVLYVSGSDMVAYARASRGDAWVRKSFTDFGFSSGTDGPTLDVNAVGDAIAAWTSSGIVLATYKPAGGAWESPPKYLDNAQVADEVDVAINAAGDVVVAWNGGHAGSPAQEEIRAVRKTKAGAWPATNGYEVVAEEDNVGANVFITECGGPTAAIDDTGTALLAWSNPYGKIGAGPGAGSGFCGVMTSRLSGGVWSSPAALTSRPSVGGGGVAPFAGKPSAEADSASGKLTLSFRFSADSWDDGKDAFINDQGWSQAVYGGGVAAGPVSALETPTIGGIGQTAVAAAGNFGSVTSWADDGAFETKYASYAGSGGSGSPFGLAALSGISQPSPQRPPSAAVAANGRAFAGLTDVSGTDRALFWTQAAGQSACLTHVLLSPAGEATAVAGDPSGNGIAVAGDGTGLYYSEYVEDGTPCGTGGGGTGGDNGGGGGGANPPVGPPAPPSNKVTSGAPKSLPDGKVEVTITVPGPGSIVLKGTAKVDSADLARVSAKKTIVVTQKSAKVTKAGKLTFKLAPSSKATKVVKKRGKLSATLAITFTPDGGSAATTTKTIVFKAPKKSGK